MTTLTRLRSLCGPLNACPRYPWRAHAAMLLPLLALVAATGIRDGWWGDSVRQAYAATRAAHAWASMSFEIITFFGSPLLYGVYLFLLLRALRFPSRSESAGDKMLVGRCILFSLLISLLLTQLIKHGLGMPRPNALWPPQPFSFSMSYNSLPSGHTTEIVATALPLAFRFRRKLVYGGLALLIALVGYSRIWLGNHHPVDVLAGAVLGSIAARLIACRADPSLS
jgi:undecaprenyl-diphosphatase